MSYVKLERRPVTWWRSRSQTIGQMIDQGWFIWSVCGRCYLVMEADLGVLEHTLGERETLWNRQPPCRRFGCKGLTTFHGVPPETNQCIELIADWPHEWAEGQPSIPRRVAPSRRKERSDNPPLPAAARARYPAPDDG
ncbi:hypothetical protein [Brevundimonas diminuta]|uniref:Uncharacterized protein n=1 Tax=Brevundimonas diminuta TaxID=293 RepID=A0A410NT54_BREDI|nr:hypothetical protein [Brevundimonas diminuta]QAT13032.1 hypothetical protein EQG53_00930 [Brevundimonas diminuta]QQB89621.1 hypothetical protein I6H83_04035 [Brevundimonas diminuta]GEC01821.1 hypothetical protein BDI01nite_28850 [Brevundimonas diminuta]